MPKDTFLGYSDYRAEREIPTTDHCRFRLNQAPAGRPQGRLGSLLRAADPRPVRGAPMALLFLPQPPTIDGGRAYRHKGENRWFLTSNGWKPGSGAWK